MEVVEYDEPAAFLGDARSFLEAHEEQNGLLLGLLTSMASQPSISGLYMARVQDAGQDVLAAFFTGHALILTSGPDPAVRMIASAVRAKSLRNPDNVGPTSVSDNKTADRQQADERRKTKTFD